MKKVLLALIVVACGTTVSAQTNLKPTTATSAKVVKAQDEAKVDAEDEQIKNALLSDTNLQDVTIQYLNEEKKSKDAMAKVFDENEGEKSGMITSILGDKKLSTMALDYIKSNPELLKKAMSFVSK